MTAYCEVPEFLDQIEAGAGARDDMYVQALLERASREFDADTQHWFYAAQMTRQFDLPQGRCLALDVPLLSVTSVTNGDDTNVSADQYLLYPLNDVHKTEIRLRQGSAVMWQFGSNGDTEGVITVAGQWGYVNRDATDPVSVRVVQNTKTAVLALATNVYRKRYGQGTEGVAQVTGAGVVITPRDKSKEYWSLVSLYQKHL